ncbi:DUF7167 family protein [Enterococcus sp. DIV1059_2]|uniref:DUF7167 family protein n=1 Tax=Enterococcus sp. DIV1059_2 TaxID=2774664 RepID=UPI003F280FDA
MSKKIRLDIETTWAGVGQVEFFEVEDNATAEEIAEEAQDIFSSYCSYGWSEVEGEDTNES